MTTNAEANANATRADAEDGTTTTTTPLTDEEIIGTRIIVVVTTTAMTRDEDGIAATALMGRGTDDAGRGRGEGPVGTKANRRIERRRRRRLRRRRRRIEEHQGRRSNKE